MQHVDSWELNSVRHTHTPHTPCSLFLQISSKLSESTVPSTAHFSMKSSPLARSLELTWIDESLGAVAVLSFAPP